LFKAISAHGAVVSEVMPYVHAAQNRFLTRNRLIAALSCATLVVEAAYRSGSCALREMPPISCDQ
jgi:DNA processing protein